MNFDETETRRDLQAFVISAKRYALFTIDGAGRPIIHQYSEHGLGQLLNPVDPELEDRDWIRETWEGLVREALSGPRFQPTWGDVPAVMRSSVTSPRLLRRFERINMGSCIRIE